MYAETVHRPLGRVNTLCRVTSTKTPGERLKAYIEAHWGRSKGGMEKLALEAKLRGRQTLYEWFAGGEPSLASLQQVANVLGVRRVDLVAAYDGVTAPETEKAPRPEWAEGLEDGVAEAVVNRLAGPDSPLVAQLEDQLERLGLLPVGEQNGESQEIQDAADTGQPLSK